MLQGDQIKDDPFAPTRIFAYGRPGFPVPACYLQGDDNFCLTVDVFNGNAVDGDLLDNPPLIHPLRKIESFSHAFQQNPSINHTYVRPNPTPLTTKKASSIPLSAGMSGGPIFKCEVKEGERPSIRCSLIGVVHGSNLIGSNDIEVSYKGLIAIPN